MVLKKLACTHSSGLYIPDDGLVLVGGTNVSQIRPEDMRRNFGVVHQNISLFSGTIRDNIALGVDDYDDDFLVHVAPYLVSWIGLASSQWI